MCVGGGGVEDWAVSLIFLMLTVYAHIFFASLMLFIE